MAVEVAKVQADQTDPLDKITKLTSLGLMGTKLAGLGTAPAQDSTAMSRRQAALDGSAFGVNKPNNSGY